MCQKLSMYGMYGTLLAFSVHHTVSFLYTVQLFFEQCTISFLLYVLYIKKPPPYSALALLATSLQYIDNLLPYSTLLEFFYRHILYSASC